MRAFHSDKRSTHERERNNKEGPDPFCMTEQERARYMVRHARCLLVVFVVTLTHRHGIVCGHKGELHKLRS